MVFSFSCSNNYWINLFPVGFVLNNW